MSNRKNRFKSFNKVSSKFKKTCSNFDDFVLGSDEKSDDAKKSKDSDSYNLDNMIAPKHSNYDKENSNSDFKSLGSDNLNSLGSSSEDDDFDKKYAKYLFGNDLELDNNNSNSREGLFNEYLNDLDEGNNESSEKFDDNLKWGDDFNNDNNLNKNLSRDNFRNKDTNRINDDNGSGLLGFKKNLVEKDENSKNHFGKIVVCLLILVLASSIFYFLVYQPFQEELNLEKTAKLNELNALYKGPLELNNHAYTLKNQIEDENNVKKLRSIDILRPATEDWRSYHNSKIPSLKDNFSRIMLSYSDNNSKNVIMSVDVAKDFVKDNDARILSNIQFKKVDTVIVPISLSRLQATAGLISVGAIVDIYSLSGNSSYYGDNSSDSSSLEDSSSDSNLNNSNDENNSNISSNNSSSDISDSNSNATSSSASDSNSISNSNLNSLSSSQELSINEEPDVSGATVLAILRSKDSGVIDSTITNSSTRIKGNETYPNEKTKSFSADVEELLKASVFGSYSGNSALESYLDDYGVKLSDFERMSNLGDLDSEYIILLEVPRSDVNFIINNMDNLILTIPTEYAPSWIVTELNSTYYNELNNNDDFSLF